MPFQDIFDGPIGPNSLIGSEDVESFLQWDNLSMILWGYRLQSDSSEGNPNKFSYQCTSAKITWLHGCDESNGMMWLS